MSNIIYPDYDNSILNLITSFLNYYNVETKHKSLKELDEKLNKKYKNIVFIILDGMGSHILEKTSPNGIFEKNKIKTITSVYPSTTTAALTTYYSGKPPYETGWIAWSQYFKEYGRAIDMLSHKESYQGDTLKNKRMDVFRDIVNYETVFNKIEKVNPNVNTYEIMPDYSDRKANKSLRANNIEEICEHIKLICNGNKKETFTIAYCDNPDGILHKTGCHSPETKEFIKMAENRVEQLIDELRGTNTLLIISADHGHNDIKEKISILDLPEIEDCLIMSPSLEARAISFNVKEDRKQDFENEFNKRFKDTYILYTKEDFIKSGLMGNGKQHRKIDDFIGNYVAIAVSDTIIALENYSNMERKRKSEKKSTHCGLTRNEMLVPVIAFEI